MRCTQVNARAVAKNRVHALNHGATGIGFTHFAEKTDILMCRQAFNDHCRPNKGRVTESCVPFVIPGLTSSSSTASSSTSPVSDSSSSSSNTGRSHKKASENWSDTQEKN